MKKNSQQLLINLQDQGVTCETVKAFGHKANNSNAKVTAVNKMLSAFDRMKRTRTEPSFFGRRVR